MSHWLVSNYVVLSGEGWPSMSNGLPLSVFINILFYFIVIICANLGLIFVFFLKAPLLLKNDVFGAVNGDVRDKKTEKLSQGKKKIHEKEPLGKKRKK